MPNFPSPQLDHLGRHHTIAFMGDSLTHNMELGVPLYLFWPAVATRLLRNENYSVKSRNFGISGNTTTAMVARITEMTQYDVPQVAFVGTGINDVGTAFASTQANFVSMATTLLNAGVGHVVIHGHHYQNFSSIDTVVLEDVNYIPLRNAINAAVAALNVSFPATGEQPGPRVSFLDTYHYFRGVILSGAEVQNSASWHIVSGNIHWNALGHNYMGGFVVQHLHSINAKVLDSLR